MEKQLTPVQRAIENYQKEALAARTKRDLQPRGDRIVSANWSEMDWVYKEKIKIVQYLQSLLPGERQGIEAAWKSGVQGMKNRLEDKVRHTASDYYSQTYKSE